MHVLIVEDTPEVVEIIEVALKLRWSECEVTSVGRGGLVPGVIASTRPDLIILDLGLPDVDGMDLLEQIRRMSEVPVIILTSRGHEAARVRGLEAGADDYMVKPFSPTEMLARVQAVLRRASRSGGGAAGIITRDSLVVDVAQRSVTVDGRFVLLSRLEWEVFSYLARNAGKVVKRNDLKQRGWGSTTVEDSVVKMCIRRIRGKLGETGGDPGVILTHRGLGYSFIG
ncbi:MAG: response regulator transcription factor [Chloroflexi bacterium]|nr:response regulator transcription factor [Chloroflexota bacterium]